MTERPDVENIPGDLDRFLGNFFNRRGWRSEIKYDPAEDRLYLDVRLANAKLSADDRFFSLVEYFARAQDAVLRQRAGLPLQCRVFTADGRDLTGTLHSRGSSYLDDNERGTGMRRRLLALSFRRRFILRVLPGRAAVGGRVRRPRRCARPAPGRRPRRRPRRARRAGGRALVHGLTAPMTVPPAPREHDALATLADVAERLQRRLLPAAPPELAGLDIAFTYRSASTGVLSGGDFVDYYTRPPSGSLAFAIGDVAGKGVDAMATTFVTKFMLRAAVHGGQLSWPTRPGEALQELRNGLLEQPDFDPDTDRFVTVLFGLLNPRTGLLQLATAGHPTPFLVRAGGVERPLLMTEPAIGVELDAALEPYPTEILQLAEGDLIVVFTDGIAELRDADGRFFEADMDGELEGAHGARGRGGRRAPRARRASGSRRARRRTTSPSSVSASRVLWSKLFAIPADTGGYRPADEGGSVSQRSRLRNQDGFIREVIWIAVILGVIAVVILDGMAIFGAYQSADDATSAAAEARTEYAQTLSVPAAKLAAEQYLDKSGIEMVGFKAVQTAKRYGQVHGDGHEQRRHLRVRLPGEDPAAQGLGGAHHASHAHRQRGVEGSEGRGPRRESGATAPS